MKTQKIYHFTALCLLVGLAALIGIYFHYAGASAADDQEAGMLGTLSQRYEAGSPGTISSGEGDSGGKSYGAYQFASAWDIPKDFFEWCQLSRNTYYRSIGDRLHDAYYKGNDGYDSDFDKEWKALAKENSDGFLQAQRNYVRLSYYDPIVDKVESSVSGFHISNYSIALRNVFWSRAVQHGTGGALTLITDAFSELGGFRNQPEAQLIDAIYAQSGKTRAATGKDKHVLSGPDAEKYGIDGQVLDYYSANSSDVQLGVYVRLRINEPAAAQLMLAEYGYTDAPVDEGTYQLAPADNTQLSLRGDGGSVTLQKKSSAKPQSFRLTFLASGCYTVENVETGRRLSASSSGRIVLAEPSATRRQLWHLSKFNSGFALENDYTGQYLSASSVSAGSAPNPSDTAMQWQLVRGSAEWSLESASYPTYANNLHAGDSSFRFRGVLRSTYPIESITVSVLDDQGRDAFPPATASDVGKSYDLSLMDGDVAFSRLPAGHYQLVISAVNTAKKGSTFSLESPFYVSGNQCLVTFDPNGGTCSERTRTVSAGQVYGDLPKPRRDGYLFKGWYTAKEGGKKVTSSSKTSASNVTLYARWAKAYTYKFVNYDDKVVASGRLEKGKVIPAPEKNPTRPSSKTHSYTFTGWEGWSEGMTISENVSFQAKYRSRAISAAEKITTSKYKIDGSYLRAIPLDTTTADLRSHLNPEGQISILKGSTEGGKLAATGMKAALRRDGKTLHSLTLVVTGDVNGDGKCTLTDMLQLQGHLLGREQLTGSALAAGDLSGDGKVTLTDLVQITSVLLGKTSLQAH